MSASSRWLSVSPLLRAALAAVVLAASPASAQDRSLDVERFRPAPDRDGFLGIPGTRTPGPWMFNFSMWLGYQSEPLTLQRADDGTRLPVIRHRASGDFLFQLGITDRIAVVADVPIVLWQDTDASVLGTASEIAAVAIRDPYAAVRVRVLGEGATGEHGRNEGEGLALQVATTLPFGLENEFAGEGNPQLEAAVLGDFHIFDFGVGAIAGYRHRFAAPRLLGFRFENELYFGVALKVPTILVPNLSGLLEVRVDTALDQEAFQNATTAVEGDAGLRWAEGDFAMTWAVGMGFNGGVGTPGFRGLFGLEFAPRTHDVDGDGIVDDQDECERLPEDVDGHADEDGCPDPDNDGDLIPDQDDRCPNEAADFERDEDEDGCTDPVRDTDEDGIEDGDDACPRAPEDLDDFEDDDGCPDPDDDGDGVLDADDRCRREPEDRDGFEDEDGCPDPDDDGDGVPDAEDQCPGVAGEPDTGCPRPDADGDGILDADDGCPEEPETINGVEDDDGCPDRGGRILWRPEGEDDPPALSGRVRFTDDGLVRAMSIPSVEQLARHLRARAGARWQITIGADSPAAREALTAALVEREVPRERFVVVSAPETGAWTVTVARAPEEGQGAPLEAPEATPPAGD